MPNSISPFESKRLLFRRFSKDDLDAVSQLYAMPEVMKFVAPIRDRQKTKQRMEKHNNDLDVFGFGLFATILKSEGIFVGRCGLDPKVGEGELQGGLAWMFFPRYWDTGFASEFGARMLEVAFSDLSLRRVFASANKENGASIKVMEKLGMQYVGSKGSEVEYEAFGI